MNPTTTGAAWIILGTSLIALSDNFVTGISREMGLWQFHMLRSAMVIPMAALFAVAIGQAGSLRPAAPGPVILRSLFGMTGLMMYFAALPAVGIAQTAAGFFTSPIWVALLSALFFGEQVGPRRILGAVIGFGGVCLVLGVGAGPIKPMAVVAVAGGVLWARFWRCSRPGWLVWRWCRGWGRCWRACRAPASPPCRGNRWAGRPPGRCS
jgi:drug/metabolite transporter (DMT)-like permease